MLIWASGPIWKEIWIFCGLLQKAETFSPSPSPDFKKASFRTATSFVWHRLLSCTLESLHVKETHTVKKWVVDLRCWTEEVVWWVFFFFVMLLQLSFLVLLLLYFFMSWKQLICDSAIYDFGMFYYCHCLLNSPEWKWFENSFFLDFGIMYESSYLYL